ncbi:unnamed protein product [Lupinus luteus]|uniref:Uncharacterized protein n=1 Tax=Lupinus luteus TaxID=3873 RepID=A0AAV1WXW0_LUPLU
MALLMPSQFSVGKTQRICILKISDLTCKTCLCTKSYQDLVTPKSLDTSPQEIYTRMFLYEPREYNLLKHYILEDKELKTRAPNAPSCLYINQSNSNSSFIDLNTNNN